MALIQINVAPSGAALDKNNSSQVEALQILLNASLHYEQSKADAYNYGDLPYLDDIATDGVYGPLTDSLKNLLLGPNTLYKNQLLALAAAIPNNYLSDSDYATVVKDLSTAPPLITPKPATTTTPTTTPATTQPQFDMSKIAPVLAIAAAGLLLVPGKKKKVSGVDASKVMPWLFVAGGTFILLKGTNIIDQILQVFHFQKGAGQQSVEQQQTNPYSPWKPNFWKAGPAGELLLTMANAQTFSDKIFDALGPAYDDFNAIMSVFTQLKTQSQVSFLADQFQQLHYFDLLSYLTDGGGSLPWDGLSDDHLKTITSLVSNLPKYTT